MKKMRRLIPAIAMLLVSAVMLSTASFAWFTMSTHATAGGMKVQATASSSLLIAGANTEEAFLTASGEYTFEMDEAKALKPATHYSNQALADNDTATAGLVTVDATKVTASSGAYTGTTYVGIDEDTANNSNYYIDFVTYIGSTGSAIDGQDLYAYINLTKDLEYLLHNAVSIDFIVDESSTDDNSATGAKTPSYIGTVNLETVDAGAKNYASIKLATNITIPQAIVVDQTTEPAVDENGDEIEGETVVTGSTTELGDTIKITMRVYIDGALQDKKTSGASADTTYVRNAVTVLDEIGFGVRFEVFKTGATATDYNA